MCGGLLRGDKWIDEASFSPFPHTHTRHTHTHHPAHWSQKYVQLQKLALLFLSAFPPPSLQFLFVKLMSCRTGLLLANPYNHRHSEWKSGLGACLWHLHQAAKDKDAHLLGYKNIELGSRRRRRAPGLLTQGHIRSTGCYLFFLPKPFKS